MSSKLKKSNITSRIRQRPVSFGNPALGTYHGSVYTSDLDQQKPLVEGAMEVHQLVAMVDVPPAQVPEGILNLARPHQDMIEHLRIVIAEGSHDLIVEESYSAPYSATAAESAASILAAEHKEYDDPDKNDETSKPQRTYLVLIQVCSEEAANEMVLDLHHKPYTSLDETQLCSVYHVVALQGEDGVSLMSPFFAPSTKSSKCGLEILRSPSTDSTTESTTKQHHAEDHYNCAVCLEHMDLNHSTERTCILTTVCNHTFHMDCLLQWQDSPCPVCRYDHSGLNEALSQCHVCGTTENNYVCLICGIVSCGGTSRPPGRNDQEDDVAQCRSQETEESLSSQRLSSSHARQHYDETLHAYALDTDSQHVWDFAGQGYVHRLLQNKEDGKLVEVNDPNNTTSQERSLNPGLSDAQEDEVVHRKLEGFASQYYTLLKSQLEQQRIYYEGRLEEIRHEYGSVKPRKRSTDLIAALKQERNQLSQRLVSLQNRSRKVKEDVAFLINMNESLEANKEPLRRQVEQAQQERLETRRMFEETLPTLQEKVTRLMLQLESEAADGKPPAHS